LMNWLVFNANVSSRGVRQTVAQHNTSGNNKNVRL